MTEENQRVFLLYFSGYNHSEIANMCKLTEGQVRYTINSLGQVWVNKYLKQEHKDKLVQLSSEGRNAQRVAEVMGKPWSRWLVVFVLNRLDSGTLAKLPEDVHNFRCSICGAQFQMTMKTAATNPDRICPEHDDRRETERRAKVQ